MFPRRGRLGHAMSEAATRSHRPQFVEYTGLKQNLRPIRLPQSRGCLTRLPVRKHVISVTLLYDIFPVKGFLADSVRTTPLFS